MDKLLFKTAEAGHSVSQAQTDALMDEICAEDRFRNQKLLVIVPDGTRTAPIGMVFQSLHRAVGGKVHALDVLIALGTHQPMSEEAMFEQLSTQHKGWHFQRSRMFGAAS